MDEPPACLVRSFSQPAATFTDLKEEDPLRALTTSISFGRFMSESLSWEKWSSFSCNRHLEEAEKFSKPGSVAEKKAYFEARHKRIAAKKAAALLEQQNALVNDFQEASIGDENHESSLTVSESSKSDGNGAIDEMQGNEVHNTELVCSVEANVCNPNVEKDKVEIEEVEEPEQFTENLVLPENPIQIELPNKYENVENHSKTMSIQQEKVPILDSVDQGNLVSTSQKKQSVRSSMSFTNRRASNLWSSVKLSPVQPSKAGNPSQSTKMTAGEKKKSMLNSLHMSINFTSRVAETSETSSVNQKIGNLKNIRSSAKISRESSSTLCTPTRASVNGLSVHPSATSPSKRKRNISLDDCSVSGRRTADAKSHLKSTDHLNSSGASGRKARPPVVPSSFSLRCEERAAKRKEFFQKLEEKPNAVDTEKVRLHTKSKEKAGDDFKKMRQSACLMAKPIPYCHRERESPSNYTNKDTGSRPPWSTSVGIDVSKNATKKSIQTPKHSINPVLRKSKRENASPNIQHI